MRENKGPIDDIVPPERRSIRNLGALRDRARAPASVTRHEETHQGVVREERRSFFSRFGIWIGVAAAVLIFGLVFSLLFGGARLTVVPKQRTVPVSLTAVAYRTATAEELPYEVMSLTKESSVTVTATGEEDASVKASGRIVIYNDFDSNGQRLIRNTRFETGNGLIYRINQSIVVPGRKVEGGKTAPGSIEVEVFADEPGEKYNIALTDFTIPGFAGTPRFEKFYARSKTPMEGGFVGKRLIVEEGAEVAAREVLRGKLREELLVEALAQKPNGFYLFPDGIFVEYSSLPQGDAGKSITLSEQATLHGVLLPEIAFANIIARQTVAGFDDTDVQIANPDALSVSLPERATARPWEEVEVSISVEGQALLVALFDTEQLKQDLASRSKEALPTILSGYPSIEEATVVIRPFWGRSFPDNPSRIKIERVVAGVAR